jgi:hypothetical protein
MPVPETLKSNAAFKARRCLHLHVLLDSVPQSEALGQQAR